MKPKFKRGQVVRIAKTRQCHYGRILSGPDYEGRYRLLFWDTATGETCEWDHEKEDLHALNTRESGR